MTRTPRVTSDEVLRRLQRAGFTRVRTRGSHNRLRNAAGRSTTLPWHPGRTLKPKTILIILNQCGLTVEEFLKL